MFSIGFFELLLVGTVGLLVLGPDRLPGAVREASAWINRFRRYAREVRRDIEAQVHDMESEAMLAQQFRDGRQLLDEVQRDVKHAIGKDGRSVSTKPEPPTRDGGISS